MLATIIIVSAQEQREKTSLPKNAKTKTIKYSDYQYAAIGYVLNEKYVEGQKITFFNTKNETSKIDLPYLDMFPIKNTKLTDTIISGKYFIRDGVSFIEGTIALDKQGSLKRGLYKVTNNKENNELITIPNISSKLNIEIKDIYYYKHIERKEVDYYNTEYFVTLILEKLPNSTFSINIKYKDLTLETNIPIISFKEFDSNVFECIKSEIIKSNQVKLSYNSGDVFVGKVIHNDDSHSKSESADYTPNSGEYRYASGEVCTGIFYYNNYYQNIFLDKGTTLFADGTIENDNWLKKYNLDSNEEERIYKERTSLTEMRNMAKSIKEIEDKKRQKTEIATNQEKKENSIKQQTRRKNLIAKYGEYYGNQISQGHLVIGMTKTMVNEVWRKEFFNISTVLRNNQIIEIWEFDKEKMQLEIIKEGNKNKGQENSDAALTAALMIDVFEQFGEITFPKTLVLNNNKLTDIYN